MAGNLLRLLDRLAALAGRALLAATAGLVPPDQRTPPPRGPRVAPPTEHYNCRCTMAYLPVTESGHPLKHPVVTVDAATADEAWAALTASAR